MFLSRFRQILNDNIPGDGEGWTIIDAFGGSGLLSHTAKAIKPKARVIYNDFDGYADRLTHIDDINRLRRELLDLVGDIIPQKSRIDNPLREKIINKINNFNGFIDIHSLSVWLCFSAKQVRALDELFKHEFYHRIRQSDYLPADDYLDGIEVVSESFHTLLPRYQHDPNALFVLDPPYLCTKQESYNQARYFDLIDFLRLIHITRPPYLFFSSTKSEFIRFIDYMIEDKHDNWQAFEGYQRINIQAKIGHNIGYEDNLVYKF